MEIHAYTPRFDGVLADGRALPARDPVTGRFVPSNPDIHDPAWHDEPSHLPQGKEFFSVEDIMLEPIETEEAYLDRVLGSDDSDPWVDEDDDSGCDREHDKYAAMAEKHRVRDDLIDYTELYEKQGKNAPGAIDHEAMVKCTINGKPLSQDAADDLYYSVIFGDNHTSSLGDITPSFAGTVRSKIVERHDRLLVTTGKPDTTNVQGNLVTKAHTTNAAATSATSAPHELSIQSVCQPKIILRLLQTLSNVPKSRSE